MKHAALLMAHKNKEQLIRLIKKLSCPEIHIYVHLDKKWYLSESDICEIRTCANNVFIIKQRIHGELDKWSLIRIELALLYAANKTGGYSYYMLFSGQDYPIKSQEYILNFLKNQYPKPFIDVDFFRTDNWLASKFNLVKWVNIVDRIHAKHKSGVCRKIMVAPIILCEKIEKKFCGSPLIRLQKYNITLCGGSAWWILPNQCVEYILSRYRKDKKLIRQLKRIRTPEEIFFQLLIINSEFSKMIVENDNIYSDNAQHCMTFANFVTPTKSFTGHPHIITVEDFDRIMAKKALFARKFDSNIDIKILDMIDEKIYG